MKTNYALLLFLLLSTYSFGQDSISVIKNSPTEKHVSVDGTRISMVPPDGFEKSGNFKGFTKANSASSIMVMEMPGPYPEISGALTGENLKTTGVTLLEKNAARVGDLEGMLVKGEQVAYGRTFIKYILVFGDAGETTMINAVFEKGEAASDQAIKNALFSTIHDKDKVLNPLDGLDFSIDVNGTKMKFTKSFANSLTCTADGNIPTQSEDKTMLLVNKSVAPMRPTDKKQFCQIRLKQLPINLQEILSTEALTIDGLEGYEILADGADKKTGQQQKVIQTILFTDSSYYIMYGSMEGNFEENIALIRGIFKTFKRK